MTEFEIRSGTLSPYFKIDEKGEINMGSSGSISVSNNTQPTHCVSSSRTSGITVGSFTNADSIWDRTIAVNPDWTVRFDQETESLRVSDAALPPVFNVVVKEAIKKVIYNDAATIILWKDGTKTIVRCMGGEPYDAYYGFCACVCKKIFGSTIASKKAARLYKRKNHE